MKANEIRLGNLFKCYNFDLTIGSINKEYVGHITNEGGFLITDLEPIPLTEEWLVKFGFKITRTQALFIYNEFGDQVSLNKIDGKFELTYLATPIIYVHHLQNLIHALTGEELTLK